MATQSTMDAVCGEAALRAGQACNGQAVLPRVGGRVLEQLGEPMATRFAGYAPSFGMEPERDGVWWVTDRDRRIALLHTIEDTLDLFEFVPEVPRFESVAMPALYHAPSLLGARITTTQRLSSFSRSNDEMKVDLKSEADAVTITVTERWHEPKMNSVKRFIVGVDPRFGYIVYTTNEVTGEAPVSIEFANFLAAGLSDTRAGKDRFPYMLWHHPERGPLKWRSNMVSLLAPGQLPARGARAIAPDGWLGFFGEDDWNPVFALTGANARLKSATCDNLLDEHLMFDEPPRDDDGGYSWRCAGALFNCPADLANRLVDRTPFNDLDIAALPARDVLQRAPFEIGKVCDFESTVPLEAYYRGCYWPTGRDEADIAELSTRAARGGRTSMRLKFGPGDEERTFHPLGSSLWLNAGKSYRLSAWFRHQGEGSASVRLTARQIYFRWTDRAAEDQAVLELADSAEWVRAEVEFTALKNDPAILVGLHWAGSGELYVDDVLLEELAG